MQRKSRKKTKRSRGFDEGNRVKASNRPRQRLNNRDYNTIEESN